MDDPIVWIDLETTGLDPKTDKILEIAVVITDGNLSLAYLGPSLVVDHSVDELVMDDFVRNMHTKSGLLRDIESGTGLPLGEVEDRVLAFCSQFAEPNTVPMGGSSIHFDRRFIEEHMPTLLAWFSHRVVDVSSFNECYKRWLPQIKANAPKSGDIHRAQEDIIDSINRLRFYQTNMLNTKWISDAGIF